MSEKEIWKDIEGLEGAFQVSYLGRVRSLPRIDARGNHRKGILRKQRKNRGGYLQVSLGHNGKEANYQVHRLVAMAFLGNPDNLPQVNHRDENKTNNAASNLEWCEGKYNANYGSRNKRIAKAKERPIYVVSESGHRYFFSSITKAAEILGLNLGSVARCLNGKIKHHHGFTFELAV